MEVQEIIKLIHKQWLVIKEQRRQRCAASNLNNVASKLATCKMFTGTEGIAEAARLMTSPQGIEFCLAANFPNLSTFRMLKPFSVERFGVYIDTGTITLKNPKTVVLIGKTTATIECDTCEIHTIITMHGAAVTVIASGWAVVRTEAGKSTNIVKRATDHAIIL